MAQNENNPAPGFPDNYAALFKNMPDGAAMHRILLDDKGAPCDYIFLDVNPEFERITGLKRDAVLNRKVTEIIPGIEKDPSNLIALYGRAALTGKTAQIETYFKPLKRWFKIKAYSPEKMYFVALFEDITSRVETEQELAKNRRDLDYAQSVANTGSWRLDIKENRLEWSDESYRIFGMPKNETMNYEKFLALVHPDDRKLVDSRWNDALKGAPYEVEHRIITGSTTKWVRERAVLEFDGKGALSGGFGTVQDITRYKDIQEELRQSYEKTGRILETANEGVLITDGERKTTFVNSKMADMLGYTREEILGRVPAEFLDPGVHLDVAKERVKLDKNRALSKEFAFLRKDKTRLWVASNAAAEFDAENRLVRTISMITDISARRQAEENLIRKQEELQAMLDLVPAWIFYKDRENRFIKVNRAYCEAMEMPKEQLEGKSLFDLYPAEQASGFWRDDKEVIASGRPKMGILESITSKNGEIYLNTDKIPYRDAAGKIIGVIGFAVDITARVKAENNLRKFNRMLRAMNSINQVLTRSKSEHHYLEKACGIITKECGYKFAWVGLAVNDREKSVLPAAQAGFGKGYLKKLKITWAGNERGSGPTGRAIREGKTAMCRNLITDPNFRPWRDEALKRGYASSIAIPLKAGGAVLGAFMLYSAEPDPFTQEEVRLLEEMAVDVAHGITLMRERVKNALAETKIKKLATFPELNPNPISETDIQGGIVYINPAFRRIFPDVKKGAAAHPWFKGLRPYFKRLKRANGSTFTRDIQSGGRHFMQTIALLPDEKKIRAYGVDITKRKAAEADLQKLYAGMEEKVRQRTAELVAARHLADIGMLAATVAHELRNPLGVISAAVYNLRRKIKDRELVRHVESVEKKVAESGMIINNLLVYAKMKLPRFEKVNLEKLLLECVSAARLNHGGKNIVIRADLKPVRGLLAEADPLQLKEIFNNLIENACQSIGEKKGRVGISAETGKRGRVSVSVTDTGIGIEPEKLEEIFKPFYTDKIKGTGLGLAICRDMVNMHNGSIGVKSRPGAGSVFTVTIPSKRA